VPVRELNTK